MNYKTTPLAQASRLRDCNAHFNARTCSVNLLFFSRSSLSFTQTQRRTSTRLRERCAELLAQMQLPTIAHKNVAPEKVQNFPAFVEQCEHDYSFLVCVLYAVC